MKRIFRSAKARLLQSLVGTTLMITGCCSDPSLAKAAESQLVYTLMRTISLPDGCLPHEVQVLESGNLCISCPDKKGIMIVSGSDYQQIKFVSLPDAPYLLSVNPAYPQMYTTSPNSPRIYVLNTETLSVERTISLPEGAHLSEMAITSNGKTAYIADCDRPFLYAVDLQSGTVQKKIALSAPALRVLLVESLRKVYVGSQEEISTDSESTNPERKAVGNIDVIDLTSLKCVHNIHIPGQGVGGLALAKQHHTLYALAASEAFLSAINVDDDQLTQPVTPTQLEGSGYDIVFDSHADCLYASTSFHNGWISVINPLTLRVEKSLNGGGLFMTLWRPKLNQDAKLFITGPNTDTVTALVINNRSTP